MAVGLASFTRCRPRWWRSRWAVAGSNSGWVNKQRQKANQPSQTHAGSMIFFPSTIASFGDSLCRQVGFWKNSHSGRDQRSPPPPYRSGVFFLSAAATSGNSHIAGRWILIRSQNSEFFPFFFLLYQLPTNPM